WMKCPSTMDTSFTMNISSTIKISSTEHFIHQRPPKQSTKVSLVDEVSSMDELSNRSNGIPPFW
uniref:Uncharacterized protein n=1 Tax=Acrobeloides nanus TaxID=290746 RepID=A0A914DMQ9_9BILA